MIKIFAYKNHNWGKKKEADHTYKILAKASSSRHLNNRDYPTWHGVYEVLQSFNGNSNPGFLIIELCLLGVAAWNVVR